MTSFVAQLDPRVANRLSLCLPLLKTAPANASADYRLAPFHALTLGLQYLFPVARGSHFSVGAEYYSQVGDLSPPQSMGVLSQYKLFPDMDAVMIRVGFSHDF